MIDLFHASLLLGIFLNLCSLFFIQAQERKTILTQILNFLSMGSFLFALLKTHQYFYDSSFFLTSLEKGSLVFVAAAFLLTQAYLLLSPSRRNAWLSFFIQFSFMGFFGIFAAKTVLYFFASFCILYITQYTLFISHSEKLLPQSASFLRQKVVTIILALFAFALYVLGPHFYFLSFIFFILLIMTEQHTPQSSHAHSGAMLFYHFIFKPTLIWALISRVHFFIEQTNMSYPAFWVAFIALALNFLYYLNCNVKAQSLEERVYGISQVNYFILALALLLSPSSFQSEILAFAYISFAVSNAALFSLVSFIKESPSFKHQRLLALFLACFLLSLIGFPPFSTFHWRYFSFLKTQSHFLSFCALNVLGLILILWQSIIIFKELFSKKEETPLPSLRGKQLSLLVFLLLLSVAGGVWGFMR